ncbi:MAG: amidohydrolase family protein [Candidatus Tritonobacter lacicola]|nr:amidohydrolase family protein [Candidatus Tritonobacter lacicola]
MDKRYKIIRARLMVPMSDRAGRDTRIEDGYVLMEGGAIIEAGPFSEEISRGITERCGNELEVIGQGGGDGIPCLDGVLLPGFVKAHGHDHESPLIGVAKDEPLTWWLDHAVNLFTGFMNEKRDELETSFGKSPNLVTYLKARLDDISYGITTSLVHHCNFNKYRVAEIVEANTIAGTDMTVAVGSQDRNYDERILDSVEEAVGRLDRYSKEYAGVQRIRFIPGPDQFFSNGPELLMALKAWAREHSCLFHIHSSEEPATTKWFVETYGRTPVEYAGSIGILDDMTLLAHQVNSTEKDLLLIRDTGTMVVHNPLANTILGSGMPPIMEMLRLGIKVAISTDGSGSADNQNMIAAARLASQYQKALHRDARVLPARKVLEMVTADAADIVRANAGRLEPGRKADVILISLERTNLVPTRADNVIENLIWAANGDEIRYVIAGGKVLLDDYRFVTLDEQTIKSEVMELSRLFIEYRDSHEEITGTGAHRK